jgi:hypothetical protein
VASLNSAKVGIHGDLLDLSIKAKPDGSFEPAIEARAEVYHFK